MKNQNRAAGFFVLQVFYLLFYGFSFLLSSSVHFQTFGPKTAPQKKVFTPQNGIKIHKIT